MDVNTFVVRIDFFHDPERADFDVWRALSHHSFDGNSVSGLYLIAESGLRGLLFIRPTEKPISPTNENLGLVIMTAPHRTDEPIV